MMKCHWGAESLYFKTLSTTAPIISNIAAAGWERFFTSLGRLYGAEFVRWMCIDGVVIVFRRCRGSTTIALSLSLFRVIILGAWLRKRGSCTCLNITVVLLAIPIAIRSAHSPSLSDHSSFRVFYRSRLVDANGGRSLLWELLTRAAWKDHWFPSPRRPRTRKISARVPLCWNAWLKSAVTSSFRPLSPPLTPSYHTW